MTIIKKYQCGICKTSPDQLSHHKAHLETEKHKDKFELFQLKLSKLSDDKLIEKYKTTNIKDICNELENIINLETKIKNDNVYDNDIQLIMPDNKVTNKEALKDKIHEIHNFLRNNGAGYGMNALKVFNIIFGLKKIEENNLFDKVGLNPVCKFSNLLEMANKKNNKTDEELASFIFNEVLDAINDSDIKELLFYEIPKGINGKAFRYLIQEINSITKIEKDCNVLLSGKIYEYFIGRDETAISELGAYFTDRHIVEYILDKLDPVINDDGSVPSMIDMFAGSGGFTTGYVNFIKEKYPDIDWNKGINKIYHYDMNEDVIKSAGLELFCLTGELPDMNNIKYKNSFTDEFDNKKYMYPITNPPYGGDKIKKTIAQEKNEKIKEYIKKELQSITDEGLKIKRQKQLKAIEAKEKQDKKDTDKSKVCVANCSGRIQKFAKNSNLTGNDKEACSLMLLMDIVEFGGTAVGVLKEGVFFNKTYKNLRKHLIENFNVREVISVPQDQFENTSTKTSIVIFDNTENKTEKVIFSDLIVERYDKDSFIEINDVIVINELKGDIISGGVNDKVVSVATREELLNNPIYSLNGKDYNKQVIVCGEGYELVRLGDICEVNQGNSLTKTEMIDGIYDVIGGGKIIGRHNQKNRDGNDFTLTRVGDININYNDKPYYLTDNGFSLKSKQEDIITKYIYYLLSHNKNCLTNLYQGTAQKVISKTNLKSIKIPIPKSKDKITEWVNKISKPYDEKNNKQNKIKELETYIQNKIKDITDNEKCDEVELGSICKFINGKKRITTEGKPQGLYPLFSSSLVVDNWIDVYDYNEECIIINTINGSGKFNLQHANKFCRTSNTIVFKTENINLTLYIYYYGLNNIEIISNLANGSTKKKMGITEISKFKIKIPKDKKLIQELEPTFKEIEKLQEELKEAEILYKQLIKELAEEAIPSTATLTEENIKINTKTDSKTPSVTSSVSSSSSVKELKEQCKSLGIKGYSKCNKAELIKLLEDHK
jgi:type I restriction-modification system DNA methylase subunit